MRGFALALAFAGCLTGPATGADVALVASTGQAPFADPEWPREGLATEILQEALGQSPDTPQHDLIWQDRESAYPELLAGAGVDIGFPWIGADCNGAGAVTPVCRRFHFSDPLAEVAVLLFTTTAGEFLFRNASDLDGRTLCRPARHYVTGSSDAAPFSVVEAETPAACFALLTAGDVDAVAIDEFTGVRQLFVLDLTETVVPLPQPLETQTLHAVISRTHWRGTTHLYRVNAGLARLRETGRYAEILDRHLTLYWEEVAR
ncbi:substrate-binding periplasmic protein [Roseobacter sp. S98]|uniref:substrate-binding periplasmic protein n=1 Tax=Roseobacter algicola (ex Choi et al. 2025) (nom. illeg.) TaxID=3092138 RepID=UPI0035C75EDB